MLRVDRTAFAARAAAVAALAALPIAFATLAPAENASHEITVTVNKLKALDKADELSNGDFFARVTIDGEALVSKEESKKLEFKPGWKLSKKVTPGEHKVKFEIVDKDVSADDPIDVNKVDKKRDLDFTVNTKTCKIEGFSQVYKCGAQIKRAGTESKKAEVTFTVTVKK